MFKKKIVMLIAAALMTLSASSAFAAFTDLELIRVVYERGTGSTETLTDLGNVNTILNDATTKGAQTFAGTGALTATTPANLAVAYFALDSTNGQLWSTSKNGQSMGDLTGMSSGTISLYSYYNATTGIKTTQGTTATGQAYGIGVQSAASSYVKKLSASGQAGTLGNALPLAGSAETSLGSLVGATSGSVTQNLYFWANGYANDPADYTGVNNFTITTNFNGTSVVTAATPIPPAFFLMGSGLLGMFGLRRKNKVA